MPYWSIILLDCLVILFSGLLVYALNNGIFATMGIFWHLSLTWGVCLVPYLVGFRLFRTYSGIIRYSSFVDLQRVGFAVLFGVVCVVTFQEFTDFSPYLVYIRKRDLVLSSLLAMSLMWAMRVFVKYFYVTTFRQSKAEREAGRYQFGEEHPEPRSRTVRAGRLRLGGREHAESYIDGSACVPFR